MTVRRTLQERERELQALLGDPERRHELEELAQKYVAESGRPKPQGTSVITYVLVHERGQGLLNP